VCLKTRHGTRQTKHSHRSEDTGLERLQTAVLARLSDEPLLVLSGLNEKEQSSPVLPLSESEAQAVETYYRALELESWQAASIRSLKRYATSPLKTRIKRLESRLVSQSL
jgi:hypothetical protein